MNARASTRELKAPSCTVYGTSAGVARASAVDADPDEVRSSPFFDSAPRAIGTAEIPAALVGSCGGAAGTVTGCPTLDEGVRVSGTCAPAQRARAGSGSGGGRAGDSAWSAGSATGDASTPVWPSANPGSRSLQEAFGSGLGSSGPGLGAATSAVAAAAEEAAASGLAGTAAIGCAAVLPVTGPSGTPLRIRSWVQFQFPPSAVLAQLQVTRSSSATRAHPTRVNSNQAASAAPDPKPPALRPLRSLASRLPMPGKASPP